GRTHLRRPMPGSARTVTRKHVHGNSRRAFVHWRTDSAELGQAAAEARSLLVSLVQAAQDSGDLPPGDPDRMTALLRALAHGAADLALSGHLARDGKGHADPGDLVDDLLARLATP
ncbi:MAG: TetR-like C-terminal domain-containing protein, partial [Streptosporangiaceae bacterium]